MVINTAAIVPAWLSTTTAYTASVVVFFPGNFANVKELLSYYCCCKMISGHSFNNTIRNAAVVCGRLLNDGMLREIPRNHPTRFSLKHLASLELCTSIYGMHWLQILCWHSVGLVWIVCWIGNVQHTSNTSHMVCRSHTLCTWKETGERAECNSQFYLQPRIWTYSISVKLLNKSSYLMLL